MKPSLGASFDIGPQIRVEKTTRNNPKLVRLSNLKKQKKSIWRGGYKNEKF